MFSVVIPLYNKAAFIARTIRCVQAQTWTDFEVLIVDDGSTDGGGAVAQQAIQHDGRFRYQYVANSGVSAARNFGAEHTSRPWVVFLDADDEWFPDFLREVAFVVMGKEEAVLVSTNYLVRRGRNEAALDVPGGPVSECVPYFDWALSSGPPIWTSATVISRRHFEAVGGFDRTLCMGEDIHLWVRLMPRGRFFFVHRPLAVYDRSDADSLSMTVSDKAVTSRRALIRFLSGPGRDLAVPRAYVHEICKIHFADLLRARRYREAAVLALSEPYFQWASGLTQLVRHLKQRAAAFHHVLP
ncbi:glycosyltransferase family 2 protein [Ideonella sp. BN130291]|uniref:glycosyltransferase family 2 protein n=1 Tax=Ideonella sp. BN130291 TaxID=3112940 RepID=UPI002E25EEC6|nr:glycosyltransferase family A protein [Ideonella sp. BN130291]